MAQAQRQGRVKALNGFPKPKVVCEVTFRIRLWDLMRFNLFHLLHKARLLLGGVLALELYVASLVALSAAHRRVVRLEIFGLVALGLTLIATTFALLTLLAYYLPGKGEAVLVERTILLTDTLLLEETPFRRQAFGWSELVEVAQSGSYIFFIFPSRAPTSFRSAPLPPVVKRRRFTTLLERSARPFEELTGRCPHALPPQPA